MEQKTVIMTDLYSCGKVYPIKYVTMAINFDQSLWSSGPIEDSFTHNSVNMSNSNQGNFSFTLILKIVLLKIDQKTVLLRFSLRFLLNSKCRLRKQLCKLYELWSPGGGARSVRVSWSDGWLRRCWFESIWAVSRRVTRVHICTLEPGTRLRNL